MKTIKIFGRDTFMKAGLVQTVKCWNEAIIIESYAVLQISLSPEEKQLRGGQPVLYLVDVQLVLQNPQKFSSLTHLLQSGSSVILYGDFRQDLKSTGMLLAMGVYACIRSGSSPAEFLELLDSWNSGQRIDAVPEGKDAAAGKTAVYRDYVRRFAPAETAEDAVRAYLPGMAMASNKKAQEMSGMNGIKGISLSPREREVAKLISSGFTTKEIASQLAISGNTVESYKKRIMSKLHARSIADITRFAVQTGINSL